MKRFPVRIAGLAVGAVALSLMFMAASCMRPGGRRPTIVDYSGRIQTLPVMRVLLYQGAGPVKISVPGACVVGGLTADGVAVRMESLEEKALTISGGRLHLDGQPVGSSELSMVALNDGLIGLEARRYPGKMRIMAIGAGSMLIINEVDIEKYLAIVVPGEMPQKWPVESLKAQTVAARTYALQRKKVRAKELFDVQSTTADQVYRGWENISDSLRVALNQTRGVVMLHEGRLFHAYFHSTCGGSTVDVSRVHRGQEAFFIKGVKCRYCGHSPYHSWEYTIHADELAHHFESAGRRPARDYSLRVDREGRGIDWPAVRIAARWSGGENALTVEQFREKLGRTNVRSQFFEIKKSGDVFIVSGVGFGHRAGMCQYGAGGMGEEGWRFDQILLHYYGDISLARIY